MKAKGLHVLIPLDGSELSAWVLDRGAALLELPGASATILGVATEGAADPELEAALAAARERLAAKGVAARAELRHGEPVEAILDAIRESAPALVAMTTHGRTGLSRVIFGSVALRVLRGSTAPLLLFRPLQRPDGTLSPVETHAPAPLRRLLVLLDGSSLAEEILPHATGLARRLSAEVRLFSAVPGGPEKAAYERAARERLELWQGRLSAGGLTASLEVRSGDAAEEALEAARAWGADVLALTTHGRTGAARALYGSVAERVLAEADRPVLLLRTRRPAAVPSPVTEEARPGSA